MIDHWKMNCCQLALAAVSSATLTIAPLPASLLPPELRAMAQLSPDNTLGSERSVVVPNQPVRGLPAALIEGGARRGVNLFQSFSDFNVGNGQRVYFANPAGIQTILSRVTGSNPSQILGTLGVNGTASLFLLNPHGILFGPNARLDIAGSFVASTASKLVFENGLEFSAIDPQAPPLLALNLRPGLQYGTDYRGEITNNGNLVVGAGQTLTLAGSAVTSSGSLTAPGGTVQVLGDRLSLLDHARVDVSSPAGGGTVLIGGDFQGQGQVPTASQTLVGNNVIINADALSNGNGGNVVVWANGNTRFDGIISAKGGANSGNGGAVEVSGKQTLYFNGHVDASAASGQIGTLLLDPTDIEINASNVGAINATSADLTLQADNNITFNASINIANPFTSLSAQAGNNIFVNANITTNGGDVALFADRGVFIHGAIIDTNPFPDTPDTFSGSIVISGQEQVSITDGGLISRSNNASTSGFSAIGVVAPEGSVSLTRTTISTTNRGTGFAGDIAITARDRVAIVDSDGSDTNDDRVVLGILSQGNQGRIFIGASDYDGFNFSPESVTIDNSFLSAANGAVPAGSTANAGNILIQASDSVSITNNSLLRSRAFAGVNGNAGGIGIGSGSLLIENSVLDTSTFSQNSSASNFSDFDDAPTRFGGSEAGAVVLFVKNDLTLDHSTIFNNLENGASGQAGVILIAANSLSLLNGAQIQTLVRGADENGAAANGKAGNILIGVDQTIKLIGRNEEGLPSAIFSQVGTGATGTSGTVWITGNNNDRARSLQLRDGGLISVNNFGTAQGDSAGDVLVFARGIWLDNDSAIAAVSKSGQGGNIFLNTDALILGRSSDIATTAGLDRTAGTGGNIAIGTGTLTLAIGRRPDGQFIESSAFAGITLLVAAKTLRNNNILAEAFNGTGGNIRINASRLQDIAERPDLLTRNDISTESSRGVNGTTVVNTLDVFPSVRTNPLPDRYEIPTVSEGCDPRVRQETTRFTSTGRGGIAANSNDVLSQETLVDSDASTVPSSGAMTSDRIASTAIIPARGWVRETDGSIRFTAYPTDPTVPVIPYPLRTPITCHAR